ncbi:hypothetical protein C8Q73DRAFT_724150 [Cubamyces lactineus]|nr:hypothetical protein C8Q73DRAFT_724150 [Cubamyces lactineus]
MLYRGYDVWITDDNDQRMPEYKMEAEGNSGKAVACYIPSESGKRFVIHWKDYNGLHTASVRVNIDGALRCSNICRPNENGRRAAIRTVSADTYHPFQFADLRTTDDDSALLANDAKAVEKIGGIEVDITRVHPHVPRAAFRPQTCRVIGVVHERSKKLGVHRVTLGEGIKIKKPPVWSKSVPLDPREGPFVSFIFRYRPAALLQAQGIMPPPAPEPTHFWRAYEGSSNKGKRQDGSKTEVKRKPEIEVIEISDDEDIADGKPIIRVKREPGYRARLKPDPSDVIDLTLDD